MEEDAIACRKAVVAVESETTPILVEYLVSVPMSSGERLGQWPEPHVVQHKQLTSATNVFLIRASSCHTVRPAESRPRSPSFEGSSTIPGMSDETVA
jgi:hypothetical protein